MPHATRVGTIRCHLVQGGLVDIELDEATSVRRYDRHGRLLGQFPVPENLKAYKIANRTFEGLTVDGRTLVASMEGWSTKDGTDTRRFQTWQGGHRGQYRVNSQFACMGDTGYGISEIVAIGDGRLLVLERSFNATDGWTAHLYVTDHERCPPGPPSGPRGHRYRPPVAPPPTALRTVREHRMACGGAPPIRRGRSRPSAVRVSESGAQRRGSFTQVLWSSSSLASHR
ncbi:esterase-like activity of phytase family protein [Streptomyces angustmyceticus]|uniref:Phytase-like domain-containing protein n=1 Tax=Streptomyces angustmyceticus TaxID=285578 RepID=A0A5J4LBF7_9ACTN|nr:esterase-like activity of phytase family protein [Streptomyces angustmyceticus]GES27978.1 hypothetical protein San01_04650 [Streptomyces angustmyceticus]